VANKSPERSIGIGSEWFSLFLKCFNETQYTF
jgi:hypothetical protein